MKTTVEICTNCGNTTEAHYTTPMYQKKATKMREKKYFFAVFEKFEDICIDHQSKKRFFFFVFCLRKRL